MRVLIAFFLLLLCWSQGSEAGEKVRIELANGQALDDAECLALGQDSLQVRTSGAKVWMRFDYISAVRLNRVSHTAFGLGIGAIGGIIGGYMIGKGVDNNSTMVDVAGNPINNNRKFKDALVLGGAGMVVGGVIGFLTEPRTFYKFSEMTEAEKNQLILTLIRSEDD